jgi:hypothetical protein
VLAVVAIVMAFWNLVARDPRIGALAAVPAILSLVTCAIFVLRLKHVADDMPQTGLNLTYQVSLRYGWFLAVAMSLLLTAFSLVRPIADRLSGKKAGSEQAYAGAQWGDQPWGDQQYAGGRYAGQEYAGQEYGGHEYGGQRYAADPGAVWPEESQAWGHAQEEPRLERRPSGGTGAPAPQPEQD